MFKKIIALFIGLFILMPNLVFVNNVKAQPDPTQDWEDYVSDEAKTVSNLSDVSQRVINILLLIAAVVAVIYVIIGGYNYITAGGNAEQAAASKTTILNALIGLVIIFAAYAIVRYVVYGILTGTPS